MDLKVLGCHGGESPKHRASSFVIDGVLGIDAGAVTSGLTLREQRGLSAVLVSHAHFDHVRDLAMLADNRCQMATKPLVIAGTPWTLGALRKHFFNNVLWPNFSKIPLLCGGGMTLEWFPMRPERVYEVAGYRTRAVLVSHSIESAAFVIERDNSVLVYSGDTGPTERLWQLLAKVRSLSALMIEVSFPDDMLGLAQASGHHTPLTLEAEMRKLQALRDIRDLPVLLYHIKPYFQRQVEREIARLKHQQFDVLALGDQIVV